MLLQLLFQFRVRIHLFIHWNRHLESTPFLHFLRVYAWYDDKNFLHVHHVLIFVPFPCCVKWWIFSCDPLPLSNVHDALYGVYDGHYCDYDDLMKNSIDNYYFGIRYQISVYLSNLDLLSMNCRCEERVCWGKLWFVWRSTKSERQPCRWIFKFTSAPKQIITYQYNFYAIFTFWL